jgi:RHS repeat-associated protein
VYFRGKLVRKENVPLLQNGVWVAQTGVTMGADRLGSVTYRGYGGVASYYPYGEEETPTANDTQKFATYTRDSATGLDYAQNRYYASQIGRFTTADPYSGSAAPEDPQSWNRYPYVGNDPTNHRDPSGLLQGGGDDGSNGGCTVGWTCPGDDVWLDDAESVCPANTGGIGQGLDEGIFGGPPMGLACFMQGAQQKQPEPPKASCNITVAFSGTPINGQNLVGLTAYAPSTNSLGAYNTIGQVGVAPGFQGWFFAVQIQGTLLGDTNPSDWVVSQSMVASGTTQVQLPNGRIVDVPAGSEPDDTPTTGIYSATGALDWLDLPGIPRYQSRVIRGGVVVGGNETFTFTSTISLRGGTATCSVTWSLQFTGQGMKHN